MRRTGLFGGTFDPPHLGHLVLAEWARVRLGLERVLFVPTGQPPHKRRRDLTPAAARVAMTKLAIRGHTAFTVSLHEVRRAGPSFTVDTVRALSASRPRTRLYLIVGADSLDDFHTWNETAEILRMATLAVAGRPGAGSRGGSADRRWPRGVVWLGNPEVDVSSSLVRTRMRAGRSVRYLVPDAVATYAATHRLYRKR
ncbi:MAG TPA: nicotinate-nucleotide adenylyltransferase [Candidatus Limnocylindria bacterium]|nr:nicotinate-nucleotide adenylyltransferase [Candidatus Limnocylindria bacterium]